MRYIEARSFGPPDVLKLQEGAALEVGPGEVLLDVHAAGVNYADLMARSGTYPPITHAPFRPGFEVAGIVTAVGKGVEHFAAGDRVAALSFAGGGYSSQIRVPHHFVYPVPEDIALSIAAGVLVQGLTAFFLLKEARTLPGDIVLVNGAAGGVGSMVTQIAVSMGARVIGLASAEKHTKVIENGAEAAFTYDAPGWSEPVLAHTDGHGVDVFLDAQGDLSDYDAFDVLARGARWMVHGWMEHARRGFPTEKIKALIFKNVTLRGYSADWSAAHFSRAFSHLLGWIMDGTLKVQITPFALEEAAAAHTAIAERGTTGKVILLP